jgi:hypothetical protein
LIIEEQCNTDQHEAVMATFAPEFAQHWLAGQGGGDDVLDRPADTAETPAQQVALEELAERVSAARSIV